MRKLETLVVVLMLLYLGWAINASDAYSKIIANFPEEGEPKPAIPYKEFGPAIEEPIFPLPYKKTPLKSGKVSWFGGPGDYDGWTGTSLAIYPNRHPNTLSHSDYYVAIRYDPKIPRQKLRETYVVMEANGKSVTAKLVDWGPAKWTGRCFDVSKAVMKTLGIETDDKIESAVMWVPE